MKRLGMAALAAAAGVSVATVDRVLNGREAVREETRLQIAEAARRINHPAARRLLKMGDDLPVLRIGMLLHKQGQDFYKAFAEAITLAVAQAQGVRGQLVLEFSPSQAPSEMASHLRAMAGRCDVLAATAVNHPEVTAAVESLRGLGLPVFSLLSDFAQGARAGYIGLNNLKVGRTAGHGAIFPAARSACARVTLAGLALTRHTPQISSKNVKREKRLEFFNSHALDLEYQFHERHALAIRWRVPLNVAFCLEPHDRAETALAGLP